MIELKPVLTQFACGPPVEPEVMHPSFLPTDMARCDGVMVNDDEWREDCERCLRRTAVRPENTLMMEPPHIIVSECEYLVKAP